MSTKPRNKEEQQVLHDKQRRQQLDDIQWLMGHETGRRLMWRLLEVSGVFRTSFTGNSETFFREGRRDVGLRFLADIDEVAAEDYLKMTQEAKTNG